MSRVLGGLLAVFWMSLGHAQHAALERELNAVVQDAAMPLASLSVLVVRDGKVAYTFQQGLRQLDQPQSAVDQDTLYRIASISKMVTTMGVMKLVETGQLDLDRDVSEYLGYSLRNPAYQDRKITLRMLLSHTSTLRDGAGYYWSGNSAIRDELSRGSPAMWSNVAEPGHYFSYANLNWG